MKSKCKWKGCYEPADCRHGYCGKHCHNSHELRPYNYRKYPKTRERHIGVEIEVEFDNHDDLKRSIPCGGHHEGSLGEFAAEYKVLAPSKKIGRKAGKLLTELWSRKAKVSTRCGVHVHIDVRGVSRQRLYELFDWLKSSEEHWFSIVPQSRRHNTYLRRLNVTPGRFPNDHYDWAHFTPYETVEIRLHGATLNAYKLQGWLGAMAHLQSKIYDESFRFPAKWQDAKEAFWEIFADAPREAREYLEARERGNGVLSDSAFATMGGEQ